MNNNKINKKNNHIKGFNLLGFFLLIVVYNGVGYSRAATLVDKPLASYRHDVQACQQCHSEQLFESLLAQNDCGVCHGKQIQGTSIIAMADEHSTAAIKPNGDNRLGLSKPMYNTESSIGKAANKMVTVPAGEFIRGTNQRFPDEGPQYVATVDAFQIDIYEVTNLQYKQFIDATARKSPRHFENRTFPEGKPDHPVVFVSWYDATEYCQWVDKRLPTDIEWEKAARGTDGRTYAWGNNFNVKMANTPQRWGALEKTGDTTPVGAFADGKSVYGLYDVSGNVWEWTSSWYKAYPGNTRSVENYGEIYKTLKGGSWWDCSFYKCGISAPLFNRSFFYRKTKNKSFGFRCANDV